MTNRFVTEGCSVPVTLGATLAAKDALVAGALFGLVANGGDSGDSDTLLRGGVVELPKTAGVSYTQGARVYWDSAAESCKAIAAGYYPIGTAFAAAAGGDETVQVLLSEAPIVAVPTDKVCAVVALTANGTSKEYHAEVAAKTINGLRARVSATLATGTITLAIKDADGNTLLSTATIDATTLTTSWTTLTLTGTTANLALAAGEAAEIALVSNNVGSTGGPVIVEFSYAPAE